MPKNEKTESYDVLIIGAGPAGATAARNLIKKGYRVLIVEKKKLTRYKICSGLLIDRSQDLVEQHFGVLPEDVFCEPNFLNGIRICSEKDSFLDVPLKRPVIYNVWRSDFDNWLVKQTGAEVWDEHQLVDFAQSKNRISAKIEN